MLVFCARIHVHVHVYMFIHVRIFAQIHVGDVLTFLNGEELNDLTPNECMFMLHFIPQSVLLHVYACTCTFYFKAYST